MLVLNMTQTSIEYRSIKRQVSPREGLCNLEGNVQGLNAMFMLCQILILQCTKKVYQSETVL